MIDLLSSNPCLRIFAEFLILVGNFFFIICFIVTHHSFLDGKQPSPEFLIEFLNGKKFSFFFFLDAQSL